MKSKIIFAAILILLGNQTFSQEAIIKGRLIDYETNEGLLFPNVRETTDYQNRPVNIDSEGNFEIKVKGNSGNLEFDYVGCYTVKFNNIPIGDKQIDFGEIRLLRNHLFDYIVIGGKSPEITDDQKEQDRRLREDVLKKYKIEMFGKKFSPYFEGKWLVFDFNKNKNQKLLIRTDKKTYSPSDEITVILTNNNKTALKYFTYSSYHGLSSIIWRYEDDRWTSVLYSPQDESSSLSGVFEAESNYLDTLSTVLEKGIYRVEYNFIVESGKGYQTFYSNKFKVK